MNFCKGFPLCRLAKIPKINLDISSLIKFTSSFIAYIAELCKSNEHVLKNHKISNDMVDCIFNFIYRMDQKDLKCSHILPYYTAIMFII